MKGIDVSQHQGSIDFGKIKAAGYGFVICKATEGQDFVDPTFVRARVRLIREAGLRVGVYHYLRPRPGRTGDVEARWAVKVARERGALKPGDFVLAVDVEESAFSGARATRRYVQQFVREYQRLTGHYPLFYSFPSFIRTVGFGRWLAKRCRLWIAHFGVSTPDVPEPFHAVIHQHSSTGRVPGVSGAVDLNVRMGRFVPIVPHRKPEPKTLTRRERLVRTWRRRRAAFLDVRTDAALRKYLFAKARLGRWDKRYLLHWGPDGNVTPAVKQFWTRAYAAGLVPTSGRRVPRFAGDNSHHIRGEAGDVGVRRELLPLGPEGVRRMVRFQHAEFKRGGHRELIGPDNWKCILRGAPAVLGEGTPLETQHDNHVHEAP